MGNYYDRPAPYCSQIDQQTQTEDELAHNLRFYPLDKYFYLIAAPIAFFASLFTILTFFKFKKSRKQPGDIILAISIGEAILSIHWFTSACYAIYNDGDSPPSYSAACIGEAVISIPSAIADYVYNCMFSVSIMEGLSLFGTCSIRQSDNFGYLGIIIIFLYLCFTWITIGYFKKVVPDTEEYKKIRSEFLNYYVIYVSFTSVMWSIYAICYTQNFLINVFVTIGNLVKLGNPLCLAFIRYKDPIIKKKVRKLWKYIFDKQKESQINDSLIDLIENPSDIFQNLQNKLRISQVYTLLSGVVISIKESVRTNTLSLFEITKEDCQDQFTLTINDDIISNYSHLKINFSAFESDITIYAPKLFKTLIEMDRKMVNFDKSFDMHQNWEQIKQQFGDNDGGRSGQFFYYSYDNKLIIKTMTDEEKFSFLSKSYEYCQHLANQEDSMISKIYGIFTVTRKNIHQKENLLVMRNICACDIKYM